MDVFIFILAGLVYLLVGYVIASGWYADNCYKYKNWVVPTLVALSIELFWGVITILGLPITVLRPIIEGLVFSAKEKFFHREKIKEE